MAFHIDHTNMVQHIADKTFSTTCPHCNAFSGLSLVSAPRYEYSGYALHSRLPHILWLAGPPAA